MEGWLLPPPSSRSSLLARISTATCSSPTFSTAISDGSVSRPASSRLSPATLSTATPETPVRRPLRPLASLAALPVIQRATSSSPTLSTIVFAASELMERSTILPVLTLARVGRRVTTASPRRRSFMDRPHSLSMPRTTFTLQTARIIVFGSSMAQQVSSAPSPAPEASASPATPGLPWPPPSTVPAGLRSTRPAISSLPTATITASGGSMARPGSSRPSPAPVTLPSVVTTALPSPPSSTFRSI